jgi:hypothetical protein
VFSRLRLAIVASVVAVGAAGIAIAADRTERTATAGKIERAFHSVGAERGVHSDDLIGASIRNGRDETIGVIDALLVSPDGGPVGVVIEVGGFLGIGAKQIVVPLNQITLADNRVFLPTATKAELERAPPFVRTRTSMLR